MNYTLTVEHAKTAAEQGWLREWTLDFLDNEGSNSGLAHEICKRPEAQVALSKFELGKLKRVMGPEKDMIWQEDANVWRERVDNIKNHLSNSNIDLPPLIATDFWDELHLSDGNHRHQALLELGIHSYWTFLRLSGPKILQFIRNNGSRNPF